MGYYRALDDLLDRAKGGDRVLHNVSDMMSHSVLDRHGIIMDKILDMKKTTSINNKSET